MSVVREVGFFDLNMAVDYGDGDFCLARPGGLAIASFILRTPNCITSKVRVSCGRSRTSPDQALFFLERWRDRIAVDPYYNPGLPKDRVDCHVTRW